MATAMSPHHQCFAIFLLIISAAATTVTSISNPQALTVTIPVEFKVTLGIEGLTANAAATTVASNQQAPTVTYPVDFTKTLIVDELTETSYQNFITELRAELGKGGGKSGDVPILPSWDTPHLFDVVLLATYEGQEVTVTVRFRRDNIYVRGYLMEKTGQWMELLANKDDKLNMIPNAKKLPFYGTYQSMEKAAGRDVTNTYFTKKELQQAVFQLSKATDAKNQARSLIFMAQMISEAARFKLISSFFGSHLEKKEYLPGWMVTDLEQKWGKYSTAVQCSDKWKKKYKYKTVTINGVEYKTVEQLRDQVLGIMLKERDLSERNCGIKKLADENGGEAALVVSVDM